MEDYKKLENSIVSNPEEMYVENSDEYNPNYKTTIFDKLKIITNYLGSNEDIDIDNDIDNDIDENQNYRDSNIFIENYPEDKEDKKDEEDKNKKSRKTYNVSYVDNIESIDYNYCDFSNGCLPNYPGEFSITSDNFFEFFDEEKSINNVVACSNDDDFCKSSTKISDISSSYLFDKDQSILPDKDYLPFEKYDQEGYQKEKVKYKRQKNINRLGVVTLSTVVVMGSAWINNFIN